MSHLEDDWEIRSLTYLYARAMDRNEPETIDRIFTPDAVLRRPSMVWEGVEAIRKVPAWLHERYLKMNHHVHNHLAEIDGDTAVAETCGLAHMVGRGPGGNVFVYQLSLRYQDSMVRTPEGWRFTRRDLVYDWSTTASAHLESNA